MSKTKASVKNSPLNPLKIKKLKTSRLAVFKAKEERNKEFFESIQQQADKETTAFMGESIYFSLKQCMIEARKNKALRKLTSRRDFIIDLDKLVEKIAVSNKRILSDITILSKKYNKKGLSNHIKKHILNVITEATEQTFRDYRKPLEEGNKIEKYKPFCYCKIASHDLKLKEDWHWLPQPDAPKFPCLDHIDPIELGPRVKNIKNDKGEIIKIITTPETIKAPIAASVVPVVASLVAGDTITAEEFIANRKNKIKRSKLQNQSIRFVARNKNLDSRGFARKKKGKK